jgi:hypothetical protein
MPVTRAAAPRRSRALGGVFPLRGHVDGGSVDAHQILKGFIDRTDRVPQLIESFVLETAWFSELRIKCV